jgi:hypothetical protein
MLNYYLIKISITFWVSLNVIKTDEQGKIFMDCHSSDGRGPDVRNNSRTSSACREVPVLK